MVGVSGPMKVGRDVLETGALPGLAGCTGQLGLLQWAQQAGKMWVGEGRAASLNGLGFEGLIKVGRDVSRSLFFTFALLIIKYVGLTLP